MRVLSSTPDIRRPLKLGLALVLLFGVSARAAFARPSDAFDWLPSLPVALLQQLGRKAPSGSSPG